jgi:cell division protein ZapA (FtsZ GTPase activity inhibitor)
MGDEEMSMDTEVSMDSPADTEPMDMGAEVDGGMEEEVDFKVVQKITGKLGQKIRMMNDSVGMSSEDVKYVINSILSALDLSKLSEEDKEDILAKFEDTETDYDMDMDMNMDNSSESDFDFDMDSEETVDSEMSEDRDSFDGRDSEVVGVYSNINKQRKEMGETESKVSSIMDSIFAESKVDKVLSSYFVLSESEIEKSEKQKSEVDSKMSKVKKLSETIEQELAAEFIIKENSELKLMGKTNKNNLVFESNGEQFRISPKGELL